MNRTDADRLWAHVQSMLRHPGPPDDYELRRAARMLASSRADAVELLLAHWLAQQKPGDARPVVQGDVRPAVEGDPRAEDPVQPTPSGPLPAEAAAAPGRAAPRFGLREAALVTAGVTAGVAGGVLLTGLLGDDADLDLG